MKLSGVRPSVSLSDSVCRFVRLSRQHQRAAGLLLWARRPESIDCCTAGGLTVSSSRAVLRSSKCGQCHVVS